jgi:SSS family solute:Na+ symporter
VLAQSIGALEVIVVLVYLLVTAYLGWLGYRHTRNAADYLVAGRKTHPVIMALSYGATFISTSAIVGFGGAAGMFGMSLIWLTVFNILVGIFIAFVVLGGPTRHMGHRLDAHTFPELLGRRYDSRAIQILTGAIIFLFMPLYAAAVIIGGSEFVTKVFGVDYEKAVLIFSAIVAVYVVAGGMKGVMYTDALQGGLMFIGMTLLLIWTYVMLGGVGQVHGDLTEMGKAPSLFGKIGFQGFTSMPEFGWGVKPAIAATATTPAVAANPDAYNLWWIIISTLVMGVGIGVLAQPQLAVRFMTVRSRKQLNRGVLVGGVFILMMTGVAFTVGAVSNVYFQNKEVIRGKVTEVVAQAPVFIKKERGLAPKAVCNLLRIDVNGDGAPDTTVVAEGVNETAPDSKVAKPWAKLMPRAEIADAASGEKIEFATLSARLAGDLKGRDLLVRPRATAFTRAVIRQGNDWEFSSDSIIPIFINQAFPSWFSVVILVTLLAAAMSTLSSQFHTLGAAIGRDVFEQATGMHNRGVIVTRIGMILGIIVAVAFSLYARGDYIIPRATAIFFGMCASAFLPAFVGGLFFKRATRPAAKASIFVGFLVTVFWLAFINDKEARALGLCNALFGKHSLLVNAAGQATAPNWQVVDQLFVALPISLLTLVVVSLLTKRPTDQHLAKCFRGHKVDG